MFFQVTGRKNSTAYGPAVHLKFSTEILCRESSRIRIFYHGVFTLKAKSHSIMGKFISTVERMLERISVTTVKRQIFSRWRQ